MAQLVKAFANKPDNSNLISKTHPKVEEENYVKLSSDLHTHVPHSQIHICIIII